ncbi:MAG: DUF2827 family protein, partial [Polaromonas sp.]|nr:DUF2827 family protein [Polaromonas sp.]
MSSAEPAHNPASGTTQSPPDRLRVGVSIYVRKGEQSLWENGIYQNCLFLVM